MMCQRIGRSPIGSIGFGRNSVSSRSRVPLPPQRITTFIARLRARWYYAPSRAHMDFRVAARPSLSATEARKFIPLRLASRQVAQTDDLADYARKLATSHDPAHSR